MLQSFSKTPLDETERDRIEHIRFLTHGDFKTVRKRLTFFPQSRICHRKIIDLLQAEATIKKTNANQRAIGF